MIKKCIILLLLLISLLSFPSYSQNNDPQFNSPLFEKTYHNKDLSGISFKCMLQNHPRYLRLGSKVGLMIYDGYSIEVLRPPLNVSRDFKEGITKTDYENKTNSLWAGVLKSLNKFDRAQNLFQTYKFNPQDSKSLNRNGNRSPPYFF